MIKLIVNLYERYAQRATLGFFCAVLVASLYTYVVLKMVERVKGSDYISHAKFAEGLLNGETELLPHFLYQFILIFIHKLTDLSFVNSAVIIVFIMVFASFIIAYKNIEANTKVNKYILSLGVIFLLLSHPLAILAPLDKHLYLGYIAPNVYHNLTLLLLKPIALLHFIMVCDVLSENESSANISKRIILIVFLTSLSVIAKPNYIIVLLPALFSYILAHQFILRKRISKREVILSLAVAIPAIVILAWQYFWFYGGDSDNHIGINIFGFFQVYSELWTLVPKLLLSIAFPLSLVYLLGGSLYRRKDFQLALYMFCISLVYAYVLVESINGNISHGNFMWSAQIAYFIFLFVCVKSYLGYLSGNKKGRGVIAFVPIIVGSSQLLFGLVWYYSNITPEFWLHL